MTRKTFVIVPDGMPRPERRALDKYLRELAAAGATGQETLRQDLRLPEPAHAGRIGPGLTDGGYWNLAQARVPAHQTTSQHLSGIYPFVADSGRGHTGPVLGVDVNADGLFHYAPWEAYRDDTARGAFSTNILVLGAYRAGKSAVIKTLVFRSLAFGHQAIVPSDPKGEWVAVALYVGGSVIRLGGGQPTRLNPLDRGPRRTGSTDAQDEEMVKQRRITVLVTLVEQASRQPLSELQHAVLQLALDDAITATDDRPTLRAVYQQLINIDARISPKQVSKRMARAAENPMFVLRRFVEGDLSGLFEDESTVEFDEDAPMVVVDTSELFSRSEIVAQLVQTCTAAWTQAVISDRGSSRTRYLIREEGWRDMKSRASLEMYQQWLKLSRHYGVSNVVILHRMGDLDTVGEAGSRERSLAYTIAGEIENKFIFRVNQQEETNLRERLNLPASHIPIARKLRKGEFLAYVGDFGYVVDCFATSTPQERELFNTDEAIDQKRPDVDDFDLDLLELVWPTAPDRSVLAWLAAAEKTHT